MKDDKLGKPLITLKSEYRDLKYSTFGETPYVYHKVPDYDEPDHKHNQVNARIDDLKRITKMLASKPGFKFLKNQALLQQVDTLQTLKSASKKKGGGFNFKGLGKAIAKKAIKTATNTVTATASILAQVPVNGTGTHFIRGLVPSGYLQSGGSRDTGFGQFLADQGIGGGVNGGALALNGETIPVNVDEVLRKKLSESELARLYPLHYYTPQRAPDTSGKTSTILGTPGSVISKLPLKNSKNISRFKVKDINGKEVEVDQKPVTPDLLKYQPHEGIPGRSDTSFKLNGSYTTSPVNIQVKYKLGDQGNKDSAYNGVDQINKLGVSTESLLQSEGKDIIPFEFNVFEPGKERFLYFRAFLDSLDDSYTGNWSGAKYVGRAEEFYTYQGFNRNINFSFKVAALSKDELLPLYKKLNYLAASTAPSYASNGEFMKGTLCAVTIGDYLSKQNGFISSVNLTWQTNYPWEIDSEDTGRAIVPHILDVSVSFTPIHDFNVKSDIDTDIGETYFGPATVARSKKLRPLAVASAPVQPFDTGGPTASTNMPIPPIQPPKPLVGSVEVGQGAFGGPFDQGDYIDLEYVDENQLDG